jgi:methyl-accepting chemotaxis protein
MGAAGYVSISGILPTNSQSEGEEEMNRATIGKKLYLAFSAILILIVVLGGLSIFQLTDITNTYDVLLSSYQGVSNNAKNVQISLLTARRHEKDFLARRNKKYIKRMDKTLTDMTTLLREMAEDVDRMKLDSIAAEIQIALKAVSSYGNAFAKVTDQIVAQGGKNTGIRGNMFKLAQALETGIDEIGSPELMVEYLLLRRNEKDFILREDETYIKNAQSVVENMFTVINRVPAENALKNNIQTLSKAYLDSLNAFALNIAGIKTYYPVMSGSTSTVGRSVLKINKQISDIVALKVSDTQKQKRFTIWLLYISCGVIVCIGIVLSFLSVRAIAKPLKRVIQSLNEGAQQVAAASGQVSSASQSLAEGASEQAASIEETSSSLEEMSSMTKQNTDNAQQADTLMEEAKQIVGQANGAMTALTDSIEEISMASQETSKIIKTIDEIAFQTNLLALNAAVEAARAGEAGAGFAVVADEVRNLAMRAADAAKNTAVLIEGTVTKVDDGSTLVQSTNESFAAVAASAAKAAELVAEIALASKEQSQGIGQVTTAVSEMDLVVQQNTAGAEASASASEEMNAQAEQMKQTVYELVAMVEGKQTHGGKTTASDGSTKAYRIQNIQSMPGKAKNKAMATHTAKESAPEEIIPMDDDFKDF